LSKRHGGAVPARPAGCDPRLTSPPHRREHHKRRFHRRAHTQGSPQSCTASTVEEARRSIRSEADGGDGFRRGTPSRSPRRGRLCDFQLEALEEGVEAIILSKHRRRRSPESAGMAGRWRRRSRSPEGRRERERGARVRGWAGSVVRPRPEPGWFSRARWASWASRPVGPAGQMGQNGFTNWIQFKFQNLKHVLIPLWIQTKFKDSNTFNKTFSYYSMKETF
jgi:hypothetical protein